MAASASVNGDIVMVMAEEPGMHRQRDRDSGWNIPFSEPVGEATAGRPATGGPSSSTFPRGRRRHRPPPL